MHAYSHNYGGYVNTAFYNHTYTTNDNLITYISSYAATDQGNAVCYWDFNITYDSFDRITNIEFDCEDFNTHINYNMEYNGNTVNFIDQLGSNDKTIVLNSNNQITSYTSNTDSVSLTYNGENLVSIISDDSSIFLEYDNFRNPFRLDTAEIFNLAQIQDFIDIIGFSAYSKRYNYLRNENNIVKIVTMSSGTTEVNYSYNYNANDYPISKTMDVQEGLIEFLYN